jgi:tetratricopeptide (TPR) repeat protein
MVERLCEESEKAAGDEPKRALILASLALCCAQTAGIPKPLGSKLEGFAWAFIANARRVASDLPAAEEAFGFAWASWRKSRAGGPAIPIGDWRIYDLEASLRRAQGQGRQALHFVNKAIKVAPASAKGMLALQKATIYESMGKLGEAIGVLEEAETWIEKRKDPWLYLALRFNLAVNLDLDGRSQIAEGLLPELRELATSLRSDVSLTRVLWVQARIQGNVGRRADATSGLEQVRRFFCDRGMAHDLGLVSLELAVFLLEDRQTSRVRTVAQEALAIFRAQRLEEPMFASLAMFLDAASHDMATVALARSAFAELREARPFSRIRLFREDGFALAVDSDTTSEGEHPPLGSIRHTSFSQTD